MAMFKTIEEFNAFIEASPTGKEDKVTGEMIVDWCQMMDKVEWLRNYRMEHPRINLYSFRNSFYKEFFPKRMPAPKKKGLGALIDEAIK